MTLSELAAMCEGADVPSYALDKQIGAAVAWPTAVPPSFTASLDAAIRLVPEGHCWTVYSDGCAGVAPKRDDDDLADGATWAATPVLALCAAALRAREAQAGRVG